MMQGHQRKGVRGSVMIQEIVIKPYEDNGFNAKRTVSSLENGGISLNSSMEQPHNWYARTTFILQQEAKQALRRGNQNLHDRLQARSRALEEDAAALWGR